MDDLSPFYENAKVVIIPLQYGAGIKGKMCEALSQSAAIVSTSFGAEGLGLESGIEFLLADDPTEFADKVCEILIDKEMRNNISRGAYDYAISNLSAPSFSKKIKEIARLFE